MGITIGALKALRDGLIYENNSGEIDAQNVIDALDHVIDQMYDASVVNPAQVSTPEAQAGTETALREWSPANIATAIAALGGGGLQSFQLMTSSGTYTKPAGITYIVALLTGGGGAGGGAGVAGNAGGGGGAGDTVISFLDATSITTESVTIGSGGSASAGGNGANGNGSTFGLHSDAKGGSGGLGSTVAGSQRGGLGGSGAGASSNGDIIIPGGSGGPGIFGDTHIASPCGGSSIWGGEGGSQYDAIGGIAGRNASGYGSGGGGALSDDAVSRAGGTGKAGCLLVLEFKQ